jgi:endonuclease/exonuclease/phosphatase (EEP) superfamily protein YafD
MFCQILPREAQPSGWRAIRSTGLFVCLATLLPASHSKRWWVRVFDYPRVHVATLGAAALAAGLCQHKKAGPMDRLLLGLVSAALGAQLLQIARYTRLWRKEVVRKPMVDAPEHRLLVANIYMHNRQVAPLLQLVRQHRPDVILLMEPDSWWDSQTAHLAAEYPYSVRHPRPNTYGMCLYSKLELVQPEVRFVIQDDVPSIRTRLRLADGNLVWFYGVHPRPPGRIKPSGGIRGSGPRDAELVVLGREIRDLHQPVIVTGDFNDVAWSHTTRRFQRIGKLLDPRVGRGFYNTFHAGHPLFRFPLDHLFHSEHFSVAQFQRLPYIGSDHFPILATLRFGLEAAAVQEPPELQGNDLAEAQEDLQKAHSS